MGASPSLLSLRGIGKSYAGPVLSEVDLELRAGEVHALVGENGAGKSTLCRIIAGLARADDGSMALRGERYSPRSKADAEQCGIRMVLQELNLIGTLTVAENLFLNRLPNRGGWIDYALLHREAAALLARVGLDHIDPATPAGRLGIGHQQMIEIAAGLSQRCEVLILDEPTAALTDLEIENLFRQIAQIKAAGSSVLYISHRMEEIRLISDRISVLRDGRLLATRETAGFPLDEIVRLMVGREVGETLRVSPGPAGEVALQVEGLRAGTAVRGVSFEARRGEILGFAGLMGSGRTETMRAIFGADPRDAGEIRLFGKALGIRSPRDAVRQGMALLTENRKEQGLLLPLAVRANLTLNRLGAVSKALGWIMREKEAAEAASWAEQLGVRCASIEQSAAELSGGNQQKVVMARWLFRDCEILIFDEPTRGIDVGAKFEIYQLLTRLADRGKAVLVVSSDLRELMGLCDRIAVMSAGRIADTYRRGEWTQDKIMNSALSGYLNP
jgi:ribose transport system ATP-binding protein